MRNAERKTGIRVCATSAGISFMQHKEHKWDLILVQCLVPLINHISLYVQGPATHIHTHTHGQDGMMTRGILMVLFHLLKTLHQ